MWYYDAQFRAINDRLDVLTRLIRQILQEDKQMAIDLTAQTAAIAANTSAVNSAAAAITMIEGLLNAIPPSNDPVTQAAIDNLTATLNANNATLAAAVATTPQNPVPVPPVVVVPPVTPQAARGR
jgi:hypothetical protein